MSAQMTPIQLQNFLVKTITARLPVLITGSPGIGKTDIVEEATKKAGADLIISHPAVSDPTDAKGLPWPDAEKGAATFLPFGDLRSAIDAEKLTVWFLDDFGQATPATQASFMQLILSGRCGSHILSDNIVFISATNRRADKAGVSGILEPVKSRFASIIELIPTVDDWCGWAYQNDIPPELIAFIKTRPTLLNDFKPTAEMINSPCPRTVASVAKIMGLNLPSDLEYPSIAGAVGEGFAGEFMAFLRLSRDMPDPDKVLKSPLDAPIPDNTSILFALCVSLAYKASEETAEAICEYALRLHSHKKGEYAALLIKDSYARDKNIFNTDAFFKLTQSPLGSLLAGDFD